MKPIVASSMVVLLSSYVILSLLAPCPFFGDTSQAASAPMPCCPRQSNDNPNHCPLSETIETCPFYITEAKIGVAAPFAIQVTTLPVSGEPLVLFSSSFSHDADDLRVDGIGTYLRNRVLLI
jgi:hypothetical protein